MQNLFRIYCEDVNRAAIERIVKDNAQSFTLETATGYYDGIKERALVVELFGTTKQIVEKIAHEIIQECNQSSVGVIEIPCFGGLVFGTHTSNDVPDELSASNDQAREDAHELEDIANEDGM